MSTHPSLSVTGLCIPVIRCQSPLGAKQAAELGILVEQVVSADVPDLILDLSGVMGIDLAGSSGLLDADRLCRRNGTRLALVVGENPVGPTLALLGVTSSIPAYRTADEVVPPLVKAWSRPPIAKAA